MLNLLHPDTFKYVAEKHPGLIEVANNLAALILESKPGSSGSAEKKSGDGAGSSSSSNPFAYHLDEMSDEEYDDEEDEPMDTDAAAGSNPHYHTFHFLLTFCGVIELPCDCKLFHLIEEDTVCHFCWFLLQTRRSHVIWFKNCLMTSTLPLKLIP